MIYRTFLPLETKEGNRGSIQYNGDVLALQDSHYKD